MDSKQSIQHSSEKPSQQKKKKSRSRSSGKYFSIFVSSYFKEINLQEEKFIKICKHFQFFEEFPFYETNIVNNKLKVSREDYNLTLKKH